MEAEFAIDVDQEIELVQQGRNVVYIGDKEGEPLFAGFLLNNWGYQKKRARLSLFSIRGLEQEWLTYRQVALFKDPINHHGEVTVFAVDGDFRLSSVYQPIRVGKYPDGQIGKELALATYGFVDDERDHVPLWQRRCEVVEGVGLEKRAVGLTDCDSSSLGVYAIGAPIFDAGDGKMVGFRAGSSRNIWYAEGALSEFITYVNRLQAMMTKVNPVDKMTTVWGRIKSRAQ